MPDEQLPLLPYAGTSGWSGSATSRERAEREDADGTTSDRQQNVLWLLHVRAREGITWKELADLRGWHHGQASGVLSVLHKEGRIVRLTERRHRCQVYVRPEFTDSRDTAPYRPNGRTVAEPGPDLSRYVVEETEFGPFLACSTCHDTFCSIEPGDTLDTLVHVATAHQCEEPPPCP